MQNRKREETGREGYFMKNYIITTDNNADLPEEYYTQHGVGCVYLSYTMDGKHYSHENFMPYAGGRILRENEGRFSSYNRSGKSQ